MVSLPGRRYFRKQIGNIRTHHIHTYQIGSSEIKRHLAFRDYLIAYPDISQHYSKLKQKLAERYPNDIEGYMDGKNDFIKETERAALDWC